MLAVLLVFTCTSAVYSQNDLPAAGTPGSAPQQQAARGGAGQADPAADPNFHSQVSYALGRSFATQLKQGGVEPDLKSLLAGVSDALSGAQPKLNDEQCNAVLERFSRDMQQKQMSQMQQASAKNQKEEVAFLAQNEKREGVQKTQSGLQYRVVKQGQGASPTLTDVVKCNYRGALINGTEFDSSAKHGGPQTFPVNRVIPGWTEALQKMHVGDTWQLFVPAKLAYGNNPPGEPIEAGSTLVFDIELLDIVKQ
jgi:FKBP-type peptidyl-prolyl cis-trans isomerase FklB